MRAKPLLIIVVLSFIFSGLKAQVDVGDSLALVDLYNSTGGKNWTYKTNWLTKKPVSSWFGIGVVNGKVTTIQLSFNRLNGQIPTSIGSFDSLVTLNLYSNYLHGRMPVPIGNLTELRALYLSDNSLTGDIPDGIGKMSFLTNLDLDMNKFTGTIPDSLGNCTKLTSLNLGYNALTGTIPASFKKLTQLQTLNLSGNQLGPTLKDVFAEEAPITYLDLSSCGFEGPIPLFINRFANLFSLNLSDNSFSGTIPEDFSRLRLLDRLYLSNNNLTGSIPPLNPDINILIIDHNQLAYDGNPQYNGRKTTIGEALFENNRFTFNGLEYFAKRYDNVRYTPQAQLAIHYYQNGLAVSAGGTLTRNTYTWFKVAGGAVAKTTGDSTFQPLQNGKYFAHINNTVVSLTLLTDTIAYTIPLVKNDVMINVSPNPARGMISIYGLDGKSDVNISITDMSGYVWLKATSHQQTAFSIDVSRLKAGNYLMSVGDRKELKTIRFVKE